MATRLNSKSLVFIDENSLENEVIIDKIPDTCPVCETKIKPIFITSFGTNGGRYDSQFFIQSVMRCPSESCFALFVTYYTGVEQSGHRGASEYVFLRSTRGLPIYREEIVFDFEIVKLSSKFVDIYKQADIAEELGLNDICGPGYRKALEFLIKDYLIYLKPEEAVNIKRRLLGQIIDEDVDSERVKSIAKRATWIGNDETHYEKKWEQLEIEDLKKLIKVTTHWIADSLITQEYSDKMPEKSK